MKKIVISIMLLTVTLGTSSVIANAATGRWQMKATKSWIEGGLYNTGGHRNKANAATANTSNNGAGAYVQLYAYAPNGVIDRSSVTTKDDRNGDAGTASYSKNVGIWESLHSTMDKHDNYKGLRLVM